MINEKKIGQRLANLRKYTRLSRESISNITSIPSATIRAWEEGKTKIRPHNLEKYLNALKKIGCSASVGWIMNGECNPTLVEFQTMEIPSSFATLGAIDIKTVINILSETSNLLYYIDAMECILYVNPNLLFLLGQTSDIDSQSLANKPFKEICSKEVYELCNKHFQLCHKGIKQRLSYNLSLGTPYPHKTVEMLCYPVTKSKSTNILGILGFVLNPNKEM